MFASVFTAETQRTRRLRRERFKLKQGGRVLFRSHRARALTAVSAATLLLASASFSIRSSAQTDPVTVAPGFEFNIFADSANVPDFAASAYTGPVSIAFDSRGRL